MRYALAFILEAPTRKAAIWRAIYLVDLKTFRRLKGNRRPMPLSDARAISSRMFKEGRPRA